MAPTGAPELEPDEPPPTLDAEVAVEVEDSVVDSPVEEDDVVVSDAEVVVDESEVVFSIVSSVVSEVVLEIKLNGVASSSNSRVLLCLSQSHAETVEPLVFPVIVSLVFLENFWVWSCGLGNIDKGAARTRRFHLQKTTR